MMLIATPHAEYGTSEQVEARYVHHSMVNPGDVGVADSDFYGQGSDGHWSDSVKHYFRCRRPGSVISLKCGMQSLQCARLNHAIQQTVYDVRDIQYPSTYSPRMKSAPRPPSY